MVEISVNLATHNRADFLEACLVSLCAQSIDPSRYEICVVNNACTDRTPEIVATVAARYPKHRLFMVREPVAGLSRARNKGIEATSGAFIANIDDDATACPEWLESVLSRFAALPEDVAAIGGEIDPVWQAEPPAWLDERMKGLLSAASNMGPLPRYIEPPYGLFEGNSCYRRSALLSVGCYPVALGRAGGSLLSGEGAVTALMRHKGWRLFFDPAMLIHHTIHADRLTPNWLRKRLFWQGISDYAMHRYHQSHGINTVETIHMELPLKPEDWNFLNDPSAQNLSADLVHLECLGFVLAMSGLISVSDD